MRSGEAPRLMKSYGAAMGLVRALRHPQIHLRRAIHNGPQIARALSQFEDPLPLIHHYFNRTSPSEKRIRLRNGRELNLSHHNLDVVVLFQVFCERVYPTHSKAVVVDIGANIGLFSLYAAFCRAEKVYAFEPNREAYLCMRENIRRNNLGNVIVPYHYAVTSRSNEVVTIPKAASPQNRIAHESAGDDEHESVNTISLNDIVGIEGISRIDLLKMDCEGSEYEILASISQSTFSKIDRIIIEYHDGKAEEIDEELKRHGFKLERQAPQTERMGMLWFRKS
jgi:FkbM family methyltransferase